MLEQLRDDVIKSLVVNHDFLLDDAEQSVSESVRDNESMWNENANADELANYLALDDEDE